MSATEQPITPAMPAVNADLPTGEADLVLEVLRLRDRVHGLRAENAELSARLAAATESSALQKELNPEDVIEHLELVVHDLDFQLKQVRSSTTWRVGRLVLAPVRVRRRQTSS